MDDVAVWPWRGEGRLLGGGGGGSWVSLGGKLSCLGWKLSCLRGSFPCPLDETLMSAR